MKKFSGNVLSYFEENITVEYSANIKYSENLIYILELFSKCRIIRNTKKIIVTVIIDEMFKILYEYFLYISYENYSRVSKAVHGTFSPTKGVAKMHLLVNKTHFRKEYKECFA